MRGWSLRPATVYGLGDRHFSPFLLQVAKESVIPLLRGGSVRFEAVASDDVAEACVLAARSLEGRGDCLNVSSGENPTLAECVARLRERLGVPARTVEIPPGATPPAEVPPFLLQALSEHRSFSIDRIRARLGYSPRFAFPDALIPRSTPSARRE